MGRGSPRYKGRRRRRRRRRPERPLSGCASRPAARPLRPEAAAPKTRAEALAASPRVKIDTPALTGSLALKGARLDDVALKFYHETTDPTSPNIVLFSPVGAPDAYYAEAGFLAASGEQLASAPRGHALASRSRCADPANAGDAQLRQRPGPRLPSPDRRRRPLYVHHHGQRREQVGQGDHARSLCARRASRPAEDTANYAVLHEGMVGVIGDCGVQEIDIRLDREGSRSRRRALSGTGGWLGFTDKYWAAVVIPDQNAQHRGALLGACADDGRQELSAPIIAPRRSTLAPGASTDVPEPRLRRRQGGRRRSIAIRSISASRSSIC